MDWLGGSALVLVAGVLQGTFVYPMSMTRGWRWEHTWATFSLLGMIVFNWTLALATIPNLFAVYGAVPAGDMLMLVFFGAAWGTGAILFGLGMDRLGMALGYPIIMGLIASLGAIIPLAAFHPAGLLTAKGLVLLAGTAVVVLGIVLCSMAASRRNPEGQDAGGRRANALKAGLIIAVCAGILSCLTNVGREYSDRVAEVARAAGVSKSFAGNVAWAVFFTMGFAVNFAYCAFLMFKNGSARAFWGPETARNLGLGAAMAAMWIGSFYLYGMAAAQLGEWGGIVGWPIFIALSILVGNLLGLWRGEWRGATPTSRSLLRLGLGALLAAVVVIAISNSMK
jgi:L-rhamnose-H+ transport protein